MLKPTPLETTSVVGANASLWSSEPVLARRQGTYLGRAFVEVWQNDAHLVVGNDLVKARAARTLANGFTSVVSSLTEAPATGDPLGQEFHGRVIVEVWSDGDMVSVTGNAAQLIPVAIRMLNSP